MGKPNMLSWDMTFMKDQKPVAWVYKLSFDSGEFYIGSTKNYRMRILIYKSNMNTGDFKIANQFLAYKKSKSAKIECIEIVEDVSLLFASEETCIKNHIYMPGCLNKTTSAATNKGSRWSPEQRAEMSKLMSVIAHRGKRKSKILHADKV
jgi:hypothetical protein